MKKFIKSTRGFWEPVPETEMPPRQEGPIGHPDLPRRPQESRSDYKSDTESEDSTKRDHRGRITRTSKIAAENSESEEFTDNDDDRILGYRSPPLRRERLEVLLD